MPIAMIFALIGGLLTVAKDVVGLDVSLAQNTAGKTPIAAVIGVAPGAPVPMNTPRPGQSDVKLPTPPSFVPLAQQPTRTMAPIWSPGDPR